MYNNKIKKILIYGTGSLCERYLYYIKYIIDNSKIIGFVETYRTKHTYKNKPVYQINEIENIEFDEIHIANGYLETIYSLKVLGIPPYKIFINIVNYKPDDSFIPSKLYNPIIELEKLSNQYLKSNKYQCDIQIKNYEISPQKIASSYLRILIVEPSGLGDAIINTIYIKEIRKLFNKKVIIDYSSRFPSLFKDMPFIDHCFMYINKHYMLDEYDVVFIRTTGYHVYKCDQLKTRGFSLKFYNYCLDCYQIQDNFKISNFRLYSQYCLLFEKNRIEFQNINSILSVNRDTPCYMNLNENAFNILNRYSLKNKKIILINRDVDSRFNKNHTKLWPIEYYDVLCNKIKNSFTDYYLIQIGAPGSEEIISSVDLNLVGKTSIDELKVLLKYSELLISSEGGLVHLRHFLYGVSVVIFGPTDIETYGYKENINCRSKICSPCIFISDNWLTTCFKNGYPAKCLLQLLPEDVFNKVCDYISNLDTKNRFELSQISEDDIYNFKNKEVSIVCNSLPEIPESFVSQNNVTIYLVNSKNQNKSININKYKKYNVEYTSIYNISCERCTQDIVLLHDITNILYPEYILEEILRILNFNGLLITQKTPFIDNYIIKKFNILKSLLSKKSRLCLRKTKFDL